MGQLEAVTLLLKNGATFNFYDDSKCPLTAAAASGHIRVVRLLLTHGIHQVGKDNALIGAARCGQQETAEILLKHGAYVNWMHEKSVTALRLAYDNIEMAKLFLTYDPHQWVKDNALINAAGNGQLPMARLLLEHGADVNYVHIDSGTALSAACDNFEITRLLLTYGTNQRAKDNALVKAARRGQLSVSRLLLEHGADVNYVGEFRDTALSSAAYTGNIGIVRFLLNLMLTSMLGMLS